MCSHPNRPSEVLYRRIESSENSLPTILLYMGNSGLLVQVCNVPIVEPALVTEEMITKPKPSSLCLVTITSYGNSGV